MVQKRRPDDGGWKCRAIIVVIIVKLGPPSRLIFIFVLVWYRTIIGATMIYLLWPSGKIGCFWVRVSLVTIALLAGCQLRIKFDIFMDS